MNSVSFSYIHVFFYNKKIIGSQLPLYFSSAPLHLKDSILCLKYKEKSTVVMNELLRFTALSPLIFFIFVSVFGQSHNSDFLYWTAWIYIII